MFKVGDRVKILNSCSRPGWIGKVTTIYEVGRFPFLNETTDIWIHDPDTGKKFDLWFHSENLELVTSTPFNGDIEFTVDV